MDILEGLESGKKYTLEVDGLPYNIELPFVRLAAEDKTLTIASLNLVGQVKLNHDLGLLLAEKIRQHVPDLEGVAILTVVEKALQVTQVTAHVLGIDAVAVAYNRVKPHMEPATRPVIQVGSDSITSGAKFLALYERDLNLLAKAHSVILIDDVVSTGGTIAGLMEILKTGARLKQIPELPVSGIFCVAIEGKTAPDLAAPVHTLAYLPAPVVE